MASLNLAGLKLNKDAALSVEEFQSLTSSETTNETSQQSAEGPNTETAQTPEIEEKPKSSFTLSLSSLMGGDSDTPETTNNSPVQEISMIQEEPKVETTMQSLNISIPGASINNNEVEETTTEQNIGIGVSINSDSLELEEAPVEGLEAIKSYLQEEPKAEETPVTEEKKEFFKNFNVIDVFAEEKKVIKKEETKAEVAELQEVEETVTETPELITLGGSEEITNLESSSDEELITLESPVVADELVSLETSEIQTVTETPELITLGGSEEITNLESSSDEELITLESPVVADELVSLETSEIQTVTETPELITLGGSEENKEIPTQNVDQLKKDLTNDRKPGGISLFKKKSFIFSMLGFFVLVGVAFSLSGNGGEDLKTNIVESPKPVIKINNFEEGKDYSIQKNQKKNIKKIKVIIPENTGATGQDSSGASTLSEENIQNELGQDLDNSTGTEADIINCGKVDYYHVFKQPKEFNGGIEAVLSEEENKSLECISNAEINCSKASFSFYYNTTEYGTIDYTINGVSGDNCEISSLNNISKMESKMCTTNEETGKDDCTSSFNDMKETLGKKSNCKIPIKAILSIKTESEKKSGIKDVFPGTSMLMAFGSGPITDKNTGEKLNMECN